MKPSQAAAQDRELSEKELRNLYSLADVNRLAPGDALIRGGGQDAKVHLFLEGELKIVQKVGEADKEITRLRREKGGDAVVFFPGDPCRMSVSATLPSTALAFSSTVFESFDPAIQLYFYKQRFRFEERVVSGLLEAESDWLRRKKQFQAYLPAMLAAFKKDYDKSDLILGVLKKIPKLPAFTGTLAAGLMNDEISTKDVSDMVKQDPSLAAGVLKTVNSPYYGFSKHISDINHAVILLGFNELYQLVLAEGIRQTMPNLSRFREILSHSICISRIAFALSFSGHMGKPAEVSTIGLLHDLGESVKHLLKKQNPKIEILIDSIDGGAVGALLLKHWNLPGRIWQSIEFQNHPSVGPVSGIPKPFQDNVILLYLSHVCFEAMKGRTESDLFTPFLDDYIRVLGAGELSVRQMVQKLAMPFLVKNLHTYPAFFRKLIAKNTKSYEVLGTDRPPQDSR